MNSLTPRPDALRTGSDVSARATAPDFAVSDTVIEAVLRPHVRRTLALTDPAWQEIERRAIGNRSLGMRRWLGRILRLGRNARDQGDVRSGYEAHWGQTPTVAQYLANLDERTIQIRWRDRGMLAAPQVLRQIHMLYFARAIEQVRPRSVLEVGCGNGNVVLALAAAFPDVAFTGLELTTSGIEAARAVQTLPELPASFVASSPVRVRDVAAHRKVELKVGSAASLPFADRSFDLVYTRLALEQMEQIREQALAEIARVCRKAVVLVEPWRDFNGSEPGRSYIRRMGYFAGRIRDLGEHGLIVQLATEDIPQKVQFKVGPVVAIRA